MKFRVLFLTALLLLCACTESFLEKSDVLYEEATILNTNFNPAHHETRPELSIVSIGPLGVGVSGNTGLRMGGIVFTDAKVPEQYYVSFKCQHGQFIIHRKDIYQKLKGHEGRKVKVSYRSIFRTTYEDSSKKKVTSRTLTGFDFIDATLN